MKDATKDAKKEWQIINSFGELNYSITSWQGLPSFKDDIFKMSFKKEIWYILPWLVTGKKEVSLANPSAAMPFVPCWKKYYVLASKKVLGLLLVCATGFFLKSSIIGVVWLAILLLCLETSTVLSSVVIVHRHQVPKYIFVHSLHRIKLHILNCFRCRFHKVQIFWEGHKILK